MTSLKTSIKTITYLSDIGCLEIQGASLVGVWLDNEEMLSVMYKEDYDPKTTFSDYEARAKKHALSIVAAMRAVNERQRHHENGVAFVAKAVQQTIDCMTTKFIQELKLSQQE